MLTLKRGRLNQWA